MTKQNIFFIITVVLLVFFTAIMQKKELDFFSLDPLIVILENQLDPSEDCQTNWIYQKIDNPEMAAKYHLSLADMAEGFVFVHENEWETAEIIAVVMAKTRKSTKFVEKGLHLFEEGQLNAWRHDQKGARETTDAIEKTWGQLSYLIIHENGKSLGGLMDKWIEEAYNWDSQFNIDELEKSRDEK